MKKTKLERPENWIRAITGKEKFFEDPASIEWGKISFALLKENCEYQDWFKGFKDELLKKVGANDLRIDFFEATVKHIPPFSLEDLKKISDFLDPNKEESGEPPFGLSLLRTYYLEMGIRIEQRKDLMPYEISMKVDLRKRPKQLMREFEFRLDEAYEKLKTPDDPGEWKRDTSRKRKEIEIQLQIWKMHKEMSFRKIAEKMKMNKDLVKKHFYRSFELIHHMPFDGDYYIERYIFKKIEDLPFTCKNCSDKKCIDAGEICPMMEKFLKPRKDYQRERTVADIEAISPREKRNPPFWDRQQKNGLVKIYRLKNPTD